MKIKRIMIFLLVFAVVLGLSNIGTIRAQEDWQISPREWVLNTEGIEVIDVHVAEPLSGVKDVAIAIEGIDGSLIEQVSDYSIGGDSIGDLVIKFRPSIDTLAELLLGNDVVYVNVNVTVMHLDENLLDSVHLFDGIDVKYAEMNQVRPFVVEE